MADFNTISGARLILPFTAEPAVTPRDRERERAPASEERAADQVELSETGSTLAQLQDDQQIRVEKVARIRSDLQHGVYSVEGKLESVIDKILDDLA